MQRTHPIGQLHEQSSWRGLIIKDAWRKESRTYALLESSTSSAHAVAPVCFSEMSREAQSETKETDKVTMLFTTILVE